MICRLCLEKLNEKTFINIFSSSENDLESQIVKLIAKHLHLEITQDDAISTALCQKCWGKIDDFEKFSNFVHERQNNLRRNEFVEVKYDDPLLLGTDAQVTLINHQNDDEVLCEIKDVLPASASEVHQRKCVSNTFEDVLHVPCGGSDEKLSEDDIPLQDLKTKFVSLQKSNQTKEYRIIKSNDKIETKIRLKKLRKKAAAPIAKLKIEKPDSKNHPQEQMKNKSEGKNEETNYLINKLNENQTIEPSEHKIGKLTKVQKYLGISTKDKYDYISENMQMKCDICEEVNFANFSELRRHFKTQHNSRAYIKCCDRRHNRLQLIFEHIKWHFDPNYFKCETCGKLLSNSVSLEVHKLNYHRNEEELVHICKFCNKRFARPFLLNNHVKTQHEARRPYACGHCDKSFNLRNALVTHIKSLHENVFPHICDICGRKFKFKPSFDKHLLEHQGIVEPRVQCKECGYWAKNKNCLRLHMNSHNKSDVNCKHCGRQCASLSALRAHVWHVHRRALSNKCTYCDKSFKRPKSLKEHLATHTGISLYNCPHCPKEFRSSSNMYVHIKQKHTEEWLNAQRDQTKVMENAKSS